MEQILTFLLTVLFAIVLALASKLTNDTDLLICISKHGSNATGCSVSGRCCSSMSVLVKDLNNNCQILSYSAEVMIELKSDLNLTNTILFRNICGKKLPLQIKGNNFFISCSNEIQGVKQDSGSGLYFNTIPSLSLSDMRFLNCGSLQSSTSQNVSNEQEFTTYLFPTTLYLLNCSNVNLSNIIIRNSYGTAIALFDTVGEVKIIDCSFENNWIRSPNALYPGGGGLYIEFTKCTAPGHFGSCHHDEVVSSSYTIKNCWFKNNNASLLSINNTSYAFSKGNFQGMGKGGGMAIFINGNNENCSIKVINCTFLNNSAVFGGGLFVQFRDRPSNNFVSVENCNFIENKAYIYGGGGVCGGFIINKVNSINSVNNAMTFTGCVFERNSAKGNGGGMSLFTTKGVSLNNEANKINITKCLWIKNSAFVASALDLAPEVYSRLGSGPLPTPIIENCTFDSNFNTGNNIIPTTSNDDNYNVKESGLATVYISGYTVDFKEDIFFLNNHGTALYLSLASVSLTNGSNLHFHGNYGKHGGGIFMAAFSVVYIHDNCTLTFSNNTSATQGGAILVQSMDYQHEVHFSHSCFVQLQGNPESIHFVFENNTATSDVGNTLFATSYFPCRQHQHLFDLITQNDMQAVASRFSLNSHDLNPIVPGVEVDLNIIASDELGNKQKVVYNAFMVNTSNKITIDSAYKQVSNNTIKLHGNSPGSKGILTLETETAILTIKVSLSECPPGFSNDGTSCVCDINNFEGIAKCEKTNSYIVRGFWIGQCNQDEICTAHCPPGYCSYNNSKLELLKLPSTIKHLNEFLCDRYRTGILCHKCKNGTSVYYHSHSYCCHQNRYCSLGIVFYLLSEIIPLTIFFLVVTIFNINMTSGAVNGFVLFAQIADTIDISAQGSIEFPETAKKLSLPYKLIYRMFNFDFFSLESLSFCLWESATTLDMMAVKYITITFALCLVLLTILVLNSWKCKMFCIWFRPRSLRTALTHGLTTLVVICFSQCARVCFSILSYSKLSYTNHQESFVFYNGAMQPFHKDHIKYAIPAMFFLTLLVLVPLVWLTFFPVLFNVLGKCHLSESKVSLFLSKFFPIGVIDLFQGSFKDNRRCFAGLYFLYRLIPLILSIAVTNHIFFYTLTSVQYLGMLTFHSVFQPYKNPSYNVVDSFIFTNLVLVNLLTAHNYGIVSRISLYSSDIKTTIVYIQVVLMYLPMVYILLLCAIKVYKRAKRRYIGYLKIDESLEDLPQLRDVPDSDSANSI